MKLHISENIRDLRKRNGMMQEQLAEALGVSIGAVSKWERGMAVPDLSYIVEMADLFGVSVDALVGFQAQSSAARDLEARIQRLQQEKDFDTASSEAEKALIRYPNDFRLVYRCGELYRLIGIETNDMPALDRATDLLERSILLLSQNTDPEISEISIRSEIAQCYVLQGQTDRGLELLKKCNTGGIHDSFIGVTYATSEAYEPEEAVPYLTKSYLTCFMNLTRTMTGYANYYARKEDWSAALEVMQWFLGYLESITANENAVSYLDKLKAPFYSECANLLYTLGRKEEADANLRKSFRLAKRFDAAPAYKADGIRFCIGEARQRSLYDDIGITVLDVISQKMRQEDWSGELRALWERLKTE